MSDPRDLNALFSRGKAKTRTSLLRQSIGTDLKLLPPEVKAVEKETLKKKVCSPSFTFYSISSQPTMLPRHSLVSLFFFLSRNFD